MMTGHNGATRRAGAGLPRHGSKGLRAAAAPAAVMLVGAVLAWASPAAQAGSRPKAPPSPAPAAQPSAAKPSAAKPSAAQPDAGLIGLGELGSLRSPQARLTGTTSTLPVSGPAAPPFVQTVTPVSPAPRTAGQWQVLAYTVPGAAIHATLMNDGNVLIASGSGSNTQQFAAGTFNVWVWNPSSGSITLVPGLPTDLFCSGHVLLPNGDVLFVGGTAAYPTSSTPFLGSRATYEFDPATGQFTQEPDMANGRWYATALEQGDGSVLAVSGQNGINGQLVPQAERFDPSTSTWDTLSASQLFPSYPQLTLLADGELFYSGASAGNSARHPPGTWDPAANSFVAAPAPQNPATRDQAATVLLPPAQNQVIGVFGGGTTIAGATLTAVNSVDLYNASQPTAVTHTVGLPMAAAKVHVLGVILPDETVFETGGGTQFAQTPVAEAAIYDPARGAWTQMNPPTVPRSYHSEAILLPDGRVATLGAETKGYAPEQRIEVFSPPYMFSTERPTITRAPHTARYGRAYHVDVSLSRGASLSRLVLVHPGSVTHSDDPGQRLVEVPFTTRRAGYVATVPSNPNLTPPGWYMLFALDSNRVPSVASWVKIG